METKRIAEPDYDFKMEIVGGEDISDKIVFSNEVSAMKCTRGSALVSINSGMHEFTTGSNFLLVEGMVFKVMDWSDDFEVTILRFSCNFFNEIYPYLDSKVIEVMMYSAPDFYKEEEMEMSDLIFRQLCILHRRKEHTYRHKLVGNLVISYILEIYEQTYKYVKDRVFEVSDNRTYLIDKFCMLTSEAHTQHRNIQYYADKLNITSRYLQKICKETLQMTPKQCIDYMVAGSAKKHLLTSTLTNQQIAHELNFPDQATFGQFFKRNVGMSPSEFRSKYK